ncbi:MAG: SEL1-like repeat protein [Burkholderiales bacterium]|nr:SEL1-like repeat protein [Burkholderiales bacterium]
MSAQYNLGKMYAEGRGVTRDDAEAMEWFQKAAEQEYPDAQEALEAMKKQSHKPGLLERLRGWFRSTK